MHQRLLRADHSTLLAMVVFGYAFLAVNLYPRVQWGSENFYIPDDVYEHGWPVSFMSRERIAEPDFGTGVAYPPWPLGRQCPVMQGGYGNPPLIRFAVGWLVLDAVVCIILLSLSVCVTRPVCSALRVRPQFSMRQLLAFIGIVCLVCAVVCLLGFPFELLLFTFLLHLLPNCLVMLSLVLGGVQLLRITRSLILRHGCRGSPSV